MSVPNTQVERAKAAAHAREAQGYFTKAQAGDQKAASLFVRLVACDLNPNGKSTDWGWLSKSPGESQVDGYAEDAICWTADPNNLENALDLVTGAGAPGASIGGSVHERRENNKWVKPIPLSQDDLDYLLEGGSAQGGSIPSYEAMGGDQGGIEVTVLMEQDYITAGKPGLDGKSGAWQWRTAYSFISGECESVEESIEKHQPEWRASLNDERASHGKPPIAW